MKIRTQIAMFALLVFIGFGLSKIITGANAQSLGINPTTTLAACPAPQAGWLYICQVANDGANPTGAYVTANGAAYFLLQKAGGGGGVATVFGRTGNVTAAQGDYSFSLIGGQVAPVQMPSSMTCQVTLNVGNGQPQTAKISGCI